VRDLLGEQAAPRLEVLRGPLVGATRQLAPPESVLVIGRGDEATWVILDGDLSRAHAEVRRGWDGVRVFDRGSTNGTRVGGVRVGDAGAPLADGDVVELGNVSMRFHDPAERHLRAEPSASTSLPVAALFPSIIEPRPSPPLQQLPPPRASASPARVSAAPPSQLVFYAALVIAALAAAALVYLLAA
jgi:S-DNA-T family DNA segregation ATPase FtsK/SpoIIIE